MRKNINIPSIKTIEKEALYGLTTSEIALKYNCSFTCIKKRANKYNIIIKKGNPGGHNRIDMIGKVFGQLTVISYSYTKSNKRLQWNCLCSCGKNCVSDGVDLRQGKIKTCGCRIYRKSRTNWQGYKDISKSYWQVVNHNAQQRNLDFDITLEYIWDLFQTQNGKCVFTGETLTLCPYKDQTASLDRINSNKGYIKGNVQWVHKTINKLKNNFSDEDFIEWCRKIVKWQDLQNLGIEHTQKVGVFS